MLTLCVFRNGTVTVCDHLSLFSTGVVKGLHGSQELQRHNVSRTLDKICSSLKHSNERLEQDIQDFPLLVTKSQLDELHHKRQRDAIRTSRKKKKYSERIMAVCSLYMNVPRDSQLAILGVQAMGRSKTKENHSL